MKALHAFFIVVLSAASVAFAADSGQVKDLPYFKPAEATMPRLATTIPARSPISAWASGLWPLPIDDNEDGLMDLVVVCTDKPYNGTWFFENSGQIDSQLKLPIFKAAVLIGKSAPSVGISYVTGKPVVTVTASVKRGEIYDFRGNAFPDFLKTQFTKPAKLGVPEKIFTEPGDIRQNQWQLVDYDDDGALDITLGIDFWGDFGPLNGGEGAFDAQGSWTRGKLRGYVYLLRNTGTTAKPAYAAPVRLQAGGKDIVPLGCFRRAGVTSTARAADLATGPLARRVIATCRGT